MQTLDIHSIAINVFETEANAVKSLSSFLNPSFSKAIEVLFNCKGRIVISGIGKSAIVAQKIVATLNSTGTPSLFMHAADAIHGDLGMVQQNDIVIIISKSGESPEIKALIPFVKKFGNVLMSICGNIDSFLAIQSDYCFNTTVPVEACPNNLAPTSSTTCQMAMGDAISICLLELRGFSANDFAKFHPGGALGKQLYLTVGEIAASNNKPAVFTDATIKDVILNMSHNRMGATSVLNHDNKLVGIITDGDLRRMMQQFNDLSSLKAKDIASVNPTTIDKSTLAVNALNIIKDKGISQLIITENEGDYFGMIHFHDLVREGII